MDNLNPLRCANREHPPRTNRIPTITSLLDLIRKSGDIRARRSGTIVVDASTDGDGGAVVAD